MVIKLHETDQHISSTHFFPTVEYFDELSYERDQNKFPYASFTECKRNRVKLVKLTPV